MDTGCVELLFTDGSRIDIDTAGAENEMANIRYQRSEPDWMIYNKPLEYAQFVLDGELKGYIQMTVEHRLDN